MHQSLSRKHRYNELNRLLSKFTQKHKKRSDRKRYQSLRNKKFNMFRKTLKKFFGGADTPPAASATLPQTNLGVSDIEHQTPLGATSLGASAINNEPASMSPIGVTPLDASAINNEPAVSNALSPIGATPLGDEPVINNEPIVEPINATPIGETPLGDEPAIDNEPIGATPISATPIGAIDNEPEPEPTADLVEPAMDGTTVSNVQISNEPIVPNDTADFVDNNDYEQDEYGQPEHEDNADLSDDVINTIINNSSVMDKFGELIHTVLQVFGTTTNIPIDVANAAEPLQLVSETNEVESPESLELPAVSGAEQLTQANGVLASTANQPTF